MRQQGAIPSGIVRESLEIIDGAFCFCFVCEWLMRIRVFGAEYWSMEGWWWNVFDTGVLGLQVFGTWGVQVLTLIGTRNTFFLDILTSLRLLRIIRVVRLL